MSCDLDTVKLYKEFLLSQFAAEAYLNGLSGDLKGMTIDVENDYADSNTLTGRLALGPNVWDKGYSIDKDGNQSRKDEQKEELNNPRWSSTLMTKGMLNDFGQAWRVIDQQVNTSSGFSATLLQKMETGQYSLSFRSTESKSEEDGGDVLRDSSNGANGEIGKEGFAWAQIMDMEEYYNDLKEGSLTLGAYDDDEKKHFRTQTRK